MIDKLYGLIYRWAMGTKKSEDDLPIGTYYVQDWE